MRAISAPRSPNSLFQSLATTPSRLQEGLDVDDLAGLRQDCFRQQEATQALGAVAGHRAVLVLLFAHLQRLGECLGATLLEGGLQPITLEEEVGEHIPQALVLLAQ